MTSNKAEGENLTVLQQILKTDFPNGIPTREEIIAKFPPKAETFVANGTEFSREVSRASNGAIIYIAPPAK
ncbi:MAG: hypothetical protein HW400_434 [Candidatus Levybacteria bacterium]|nr:hypothetical protein [Candidatus Levybacteria bacterium]